MDKEQYCAAKAQLVRGMQEGQAWYLAAATAGLQISQSTAYRLWLAMRQRGEAVLYISLTLMTKKLMGEIIWYFLTGIINHTDQILMDEPLVS